MEVEVVAAGVAAQQLRRGGYGGGEQNDGRADEAGPARRFPRSQKRDLGNPAFWGKRGSWQQAQGVVGLGGYRCGSEGQRKGCSRIASRSIGRGSKG